MAPFAFRLRAHAAAHLGYEDVMQISWPNAVAIICSEYTGGDSGRAYAVTLFAEIRGEAGSLDEAQSRLAPMVGSALPLIAVATNAAVADPVAIGAYGLDLSTPQEFMWYATPHATTHVPPGVRTFEPQPVHDFMMAVGHHPQHPLLHQAMESYRRALGAWVPETLLMAGEFLYIAAETLSRCLIETRAHQKGITPKNLAQLQGGVTVDQLRTQYLRDDGFAGDTEAFDAMKAASDGFEHGFMSVEEVRGLMQDVLERSMGHVRVALISAADPSQDVRDLLLSDRYATPRGLVPLMQSIRGELVLADPTKPPPDLSLLNLDYLPAVPRAVEAGGEVKLEFPTTVTFSSLPDNLEAWVTGTSFRAAHVKQAELSRVDVIRHDDN